MTVPGLAHVGPLLAQLMQEPDSFSQGLVGLLKLTHAGPQTRDLRLLRSPLTGTLSRDTSPLL